MENPKINEYFVLNVEHGKKQEQLHMFVGPIKGELHLLGYRTNDLAYMFSERECISLDLGAVRLPEGRKSIEDLTDGDIISVQREDGKPGALNGAIYKSLRSKSKVAQVKL